MATPNEKLAESLDVLKALQEGGRRVFRSDDLSRVHRERLVETGFLQEVIKGWLISGMPPAENLVMRDGLRLFSPAASLVGVGETFFARNPVESQVVVASLADESDLLRLLLDGGNSTKAGYLAGPFRRIGRAELADEIVRAMKRAGYDVRESDPFEAGQTFGRPRAKAAPIVGRLEMMWQAMRDTVIKNFPKAPGLPEDKNAYLRNVDEIYQSDAYHSLSIEGYSVTPDLIEKVRQGGWNPDRNERDRKDRDALAARGYWQAFQVVKESVGKVLAGENP